MKKKNLIDAWMGVYYAKYLVGFGRRMVVVKNEELWCRGKSKKNGIKNGLKMYSFGLTI
mgnify:CR=1 FL=1